MSKSNLELAVELYCAKMIADAVFDSQAENKKDFSVPHPADHMEQIATIAQALRDKFGE